MSGAPVRSKPNQTRSNISFLLGTASENLRVAVTSHAQCQEKQMEGVQPTICGDQVSFELHEDTNFIEYVGSKDVGEETKGVSRFLECFNLIQRE